MLVVQSAVVSAQLNISKQFIKVDSLFELGEYDASAEVCTQLLKNTSIGAPYFYLQIQKAECAIRTNNLEQAQEIVTENIAKCRKELVTERTLLMNCQAKIYYQKGQTQQAANQIQAAINILQSNNLKSSKEMAECYNTQGLIDWTIGNNEKAISYFNQALEIRKKLFGNNATSVAAIYNNLGLAYTGIDLSEAIKYHQDALAIYQKNYPSNHPNLAIEYSNLGHILRKQGSFTDALTQFEKALKIWQERYSTAHPNKAYVYSAIAQVYLEQQEYRNAKETATKALEIYQKAYGEKHPNTAACYTLLADIYSTERKYSRALAYLQSSLISNCMPFQNSDYKSNPAVGNCFDAQLLLSTLTQKATVLQRMHTEKTLRLKDLTLALSTYLSCDTLLDKLRQTRTSKNDKVALGETSYEVYDKSVQLCVLLSKNTFNKKYYLRLAYYFVERSKAAVLQESIAEAKAKTFAGIPNAEIEKEAVFKTNITYLEQKLAKGISNETELKTVTAQLFENKSGYESFITSLEKNYPTYYQLKYNVKAFQIEDLQKKLRPEDCVLEYMVSESGNSLEIFRVTSTTFQHFTIPQIIRYEKDISGLRNAIKFNSKTTFIETATALYTQLIPSLSTSSQHLIIIPDGRMGAIPFETLLAKKPRSDTSSWESMNFLLKKYAISYNYAGALYQNHQEEKYQPNVLLFAPVEFSVASKLNTLPGTLTEVNTLDSLYKNNKSTDKYLYAKASKNMLINDSIGKYGIIHLATHGMVNELKPELSCIYTAGNGEENDRIYTGDMYNMRLKAKLVALSACQTGLGKIAKGEGMMGLSRALFFAGASNIMVSLWKVSDVSTQLYMNYFHASYQSHPQLSLAVAAREAKLKMLNSTIYKGPYYWSAFVLIGE